MTNRPARWLLAASLLVGLGACGSDSDGGSEPPKGEGPKVTATEVGRALEVPITLTIGPEGGILDSGDGALRVEVPVGALDAEHLFSVQAISAHAHGKVGGAFRLGPENATFAAPIRLTFSFTPEQILGTDPELLRVASQNPAGFWELHEDVELNAGAGTVTIETNHFSDWSLVTGALLSPSSATTRVGGAVSLAVVVCERVPQGDLIAPLVAECRSSEVFRALVKNWSVNGTPGGSGTVGTIAVREDGSAVYSAPARAPEANPVAVSVEYISLQGERVTLVSNITVESGFCTPESPIEPCTFELAEFNGEPLPFEGLPRETWENPEVLTSGVLKLWDADGDGTGTWSLRYEWIEKRTSGDLVQFSQLAGDFTSESTSTLRFSVAGSDERFTGAISQGALELTGYPFYTTNTELSAKLTFR